MNDDHYLTYIRWVISDPRNRYPETLDGFLKEYKLELSNLSEYETKPSYYQDIEREVRNWGISKLPEVMRGAYESAKSGKPAAVRAFKEMLEESKAKSNTINFFAINPTNEQYQRIINREQKRMSPVIIEAE